MHTTKWPLSAATSRRRAPRGGPACGNHAILEQEREPSEVRPHVGSTRDLLHRLRFDLGCDKIVPADQAIVQERDLRYSIAPGTVQERSS